MNKTIFNDPKLQAEIAAYARVKTIERDTVLMSPGDDIFFVPIVQQGVLRIVRQNDEGKEVFLYHLYPGKHALWRSTVVRERRRAP